MQVGQRARVLKLERPTHEDRTRWDGQEGLLVRRLNVPWTPDIGELWELRFEDGEVIVFSESELGVVSQGHIEPNDMEELRETWGVAPRTPSFPFRRLGANVGTAPAVLALLVFLIAGILMLWAGVTEKSWLLGAGGGLLVLIGVGSAGVLIS